MARYKLRRVIVRGYPVYSVGLPGSIVESLGWRPGDRLRVTLDPERRAIVIMKEEKEGGREGADR